MATRYNLDFQVSDGTPFVTGEYRASLKRFENTVRSLRSGTRGGTLGTPQVVAVKHQTTASTATVTIASTPAVGEVLDINGVEFIFVSGSPLASANEVDQSSGNTTTIATALAAAVNAATGLSGVVTATSATNAVTLTPVVSGLLTNAPVVREKGIMSFATVTVSGGVATDTCVVNGVTLTAVASGATNAQYNVGASDGATAANLAAAINASTNALINQHVTARASGAAGAVVTVKALYDSAAGNCVTLSATGHNTASSARLVNGTEASSNGAQASGTITISSGAGSIQATINGVAITAVTWASSDNNTASLLLAQILQSVNALVAGVITATVSTNVVTVTSRAGGPQGNAITLSVTGTGATASGARLTGGAAPTDVTFSGAFGGWDPTLGGSHFTGGAETALTSYSL